MPTLAEASLSETERRVIARFVDLLQERLGDDLKAVWLYGSRARGENPHAESDVDLLVVAEGGRQRHFRSVSRLIDGAALAEGANPAVFGSHVYDPDYVEERREIRSFFIQEVDRDKIVLYGEP